MKRNVFIFVLLTALAVSVYGQTADDFIKSGNAAYKQKDYKKAIADFTEAIRLNPNSTIGYVSRGQIYEWKKLTKEDLDKAIADYTQSIQLDPNHFNSYIYRARVYYEKSEYKLVREDVNKTLQINSNNQEVKDLDAKLKEKGYYKEENDEY
jgi:tetratricopeptide (TPR) repeat protein